jgi:CBS domain-containing protein
MTDRVAEFLAAATAEAVEVTIRGLLAIWGYRTRTLDSVPRIERDLVEAGLRCTPDLGVGGLGTTVRVGAAPTAETAAAGGAEAAVDAADESAATAESLPPSLPHILPRIKDIPSAISEVTSVRPDESLQYAQKLMGDKGYSQLAVMTGPSELLGAVSWRSIAMAKVAKKNISLADAIDFDPEVVRATDWLLDKIGVIYDADFVFVQDSAYNICGIVTTADLSARFRDLTSPFFQLGEIEIRLRRCTRDKFSVADLRKATNKNKINSVNDMTLGNYVFLLKEEEMWRRTEWEIPQDSFLADLRRALDIRNRIAHYDARPVRDADRQDIARFLTWMRHLDLGPLR